MDMKESPSKGPDVLYEEGTREAQVDDSVTPEALELLQFVSTTQISSIITQNCGSPIHSS
ncbi:unnamed protein product [Fusarium graminearum]|nr:unnamed protein product [Fusarium graminearum]